MITLLPFLNSLFTLIYRIDVLIFKICIEICSTNEYFTTMLFYGHGI